MNIPKKVKIGGETYKVFFVKECSEEGSDGVCTYKNNIIEINEECKGNYRDMIFIHELCHAMLEHAGLGFDNEEEVDALARVLHSVIVDNPKIFER